MKRNILLYLFMLVSICPSIGQNSALSTKQTLNLKSENSLSLLHRAEELKIFNYNLAYDENLCFVKGSNFKDIVVSPSTIFLAFSSSDKNAENVLKLGAGRTELTINTDKVIGNEDTLVGFTADNGVILTCNFNTKKTKKNNGLMLNKEFVNHQSSIDDNLLELLYLPEATTPLQRNQIETYLSIKYGISLFGESNYFNSDGELLWSNDSNKYFNFNLTGIGRDDELGLNQKQSHNSKEKWLTIGVSRIEDLNYNNTGYLEDKTYVLWSNNGKPFEFQSDTILPLSITDRKWKVSNHSEENTELFGQIKLNYEVVESLGHIGPADDKYWLVVLKDNETQMIDGEFHSCNYIDTNSMEACFNNINLNFNKHYYFSFIKAPEFLALHSIDTTCSLFGHYSIKIKMIGGSAPYTILIEDGNERRSVLSDTNEVIVNNLSTMKPIKISITDKRGQSYKIKLFEHRNTEENICNSTKCYLDVTGRILLMHPQIQSTAFQYEWRFGNDLIGTDPVLEVLSTGNYKLLVVDNEKGCVKSTNFEVIENKNIKKDWISVFPNPVFTSRPFTLTFKIDTEVEKLINVFDIDGRTVWQKKIGADQVEEVEGILHQPGNYLVVIKAGVVTLTHKLIVI